MIMRSGRRRCIEMTKFIRRPAWLTLSMSSRAFLCVSHYCCRQVSLKKRFRCLPLSVQYKTKCLHSDTLIFVLPTPSQHTQCSIQCCGRTRVKQTIFHSAVPANGPSRVKWEGKITKEFLISSSSPSSDLVATDWCNAYTYPSTFSNALWWQRPTTKENGTYYTYNWCH